MLMGVAKVRRLALVVSAVVGERRLDSRLNQLEQLPFSIVLRDELGGAVVDDFHE